MRPHAERAKTASAARPIKGSSSASSARVAKQHGAQRRQRHADLRGVVVRQHDVQRQRHERERQAERAVAEARPRAEGGCRDGGGARSGRGHHDGHGAARSAGGAARAPTSSAPARCRRSAARTPGRSRSPCGRAVEEEAGRSSAWCTPVRRSPAITSGKARVMADCHARACCRRQGPTRRISAIERSAIAAPSKAAQRSAARARTSCVS